MTKEERARYARWLGKRSYRARLERLGIERIREIARENGRKGGRPPKKKGSRVRTEKPGRAE